MPKETEPANRNTQLLEENRRLAQRYLELENATRRQLEKLRGANAVLARGEQHMRLLLENADIGFALLDLQNRVVSANQTLCGFLGVSQPELPGEYFNSFVYVGSTPAFSRLTSSATARGKTSENIELVARDGRLVRCRMAASDWLDDAGAVKGVFILAFNVEKETAAVNRLRELEETMAETDKARTLFLDVVSRELRSPASSIRGMIRMLMDSNLDERQAELAGVIHSSAASIVRLVDDMFDIVRLDANDARLNPVAVRPAELARGTVNLYAVRAEEKGIDLKVDISPIVPEWIVADPVRIRRVLAHLLDNAVKFTEIGGVTLAVDILGEMVRFMVSDTGPGLNLEPGRDLFDDSIAYDSPSSRRLGGIGIGLPISKRLVALMGGKIGYESEPGRGSEFHFTIPLQVPAKPGGASCSPPPEAIRLAPLHILLADGNLLGRRVVNAYLQFDGHKLTQVDNGLDAAEKCRFGAFDLVLLDRHLPKLNGLQTLRLIRDDEKASGRARVPVIMFAAGGHQPNADRYKEAGADAVLKKPVQPVELMAAIAAATHSEPLAVARPTGPGQYQARASGGTIRRIDGAQLVNLRQVMLDDQFMGILRFFMEDAMPGIINLESMAAAAEPDCERIAFAASKARGLSSYLGFAALADLLKRIEAACRSKAGPEELRQLTEELPLVTDDTLEELKRILPDAFATISAMSEPMEPPNE